ncbi:uncharacterized [Tachysurus ichikawai]
MGQYSSALRNGQRKRKSDPSDPFFPHLAYHDHLFRYRFYQLFIWGVKALARGSFSLPDVGRAGAEQSERPR